MHTSAVILVGIPHRHEQHGERAAGIVPTSLVGIDAEGGAYYTLVAVTAMCRNVYAMAVEVLMPRGLWKKLIKKPQ